jgi:3-hydroxyacyl-CoA dehydrogenase
MMGRLPSVAVLGAGRMGTAIERVDKGELGMEAGTGFRTWTPSSAKAVRDRLDRWNTRTS